MVFCAWRGWSLGVVRQAVAVCALGAAVAVGYWVGPFIGMVMPAVGYPAFLRPLAGGILVGGLVWMLIQICSAIVFRKTSDQGMGAIRLVYGGLGACLGLVSGAAILALGAWGVRWAGSLAEGVEASTRPRQKAGQPGRTAHAPQDPDLLLTLKRSLDQTRAGEFLKSLDPISADKYRLLSKIGRISASPEALERLMSHPHLRPLVSNPRVQALREDMDLRDAVVAADLWAVLGNPRVQAVAKDSQVLHALRTLDLEKALTEALSGSLPSDPPPSKAASAPAKKPSAPR